ncbi:MAG: glycosyltransferase family 2 protein [Armatimonadota bacterium]
MQSNLPSEKKVSIIMGAYNCSDTIKESIDSILAQTYTDWEFIICDDASTDDTCEIIGKYVKENANKIIAIKNPENMGLAYSLNHCLKYVTGKYVARMDGDDISLPNRLEKQVGFLESNSKYALAGTGMVSFDEFGDTGIRIGKPEPLPTDLAKNTPFMHATILMRTEVYEALNGYRVLSYARRSEDVDLWFRFFAAGYRGYNLQEALYKVREDATSYKRRKLKYAFDTVRVLYDGFHALRLPPKYYLYLLKPILSAITPPVIMKMFHKIIYRKNAG